LDQGTVRVREDGYINVLDLEGLVPTKEQWEKSWVRFFAQAYGTLASLAHRNGIAPDAMIELEDAVDGEHFIWVQYDLALDYAAYISPDLRADILITYRRVLSGDTTLAAEIFARSSDDGQRWLQVRRQLQQHTPIRNAAIKKHQGQGGIYSYCTDELNKATTGHTSNEICVIARVPQARTRDALDTSHLALQLFGESEQIKAMDHESAQGNVAIKRAVDPVHSDIQAIALRYNLHDDSLLRDRAQVLSRSATKVRAALPPPTSYTYDSYPCRDYRGESSFYPDAPNEVF
jgi:hypothetical protein